MSLVFLKNILLRRATKPASPERQRLLASKRSSYSSEGAVGDPDVESQRSGSERSSTSRLKVDARVISDATIGLSDGLTVPFALTAGLSGLGSTRVVIFGGLAELIAGAISMGLGGYLGAKSELSVTPFFLEALAVNISETNMSRKGIPTTKPASKQPVWWPLTHPP
jgi:vacuolar iron transporter family protein